MRKKLSLCLSATALLLIVSACGDANNDDEAANEEETATQEEAGPQPDLGNIPDVVAIVNDQEINKEEFTTSYESQLQQAQMSGNPVDQDQLKKQTVEGMVDTELLIQEADSRGHQASDQELDTTLNDLAEENGLESSDEFLSALGEQGMTEDEVMSQLEIQVKVDKLIADEAGNIDPTEKELKELYERAEKQQEQSGDNGSELPPFEDVKPQLEKQAEAEKESETAAALVSDLREKAEIDINL